MNSTPDDVIRAELGSSEQLLWAGQPPQGVVFRAENVFQIAVGLVWIGLSLFLNDSAIAPGGAAIFGLWRVPILLIGFYLSVGHFWLDIGHRARTFYAVTSERIIIVSGLWGRRVKSLDLNTLSDVALAEHGQGSGTITFGAVVPPFYEWYGQVGRIGFWREAVPHFMLAGDAREVYEFILKAHRSATQWTSPS